VHSGECIDRIIGGVVDRVRAAGWETVGEIVDDQHTFLLCSVRGPET
jgi:hypothetical protein